MISAIMAGKMEKRFQIIWHTDASLVMVTTVHEAGDTEQQGHQGAGDGGTELLGHGPGGEDEAGGGGAVLLGGVVGHVGVHRPEQRRI